MLSSWKLGRAFGIDIYVHWTFWLLPLFFFISHLPNVLLASIMVGVMLAVFGCVLLHELGHCLMARQFGIRTRDITLMPLGGLARLEGMGRQPWEEVWIALAGPAVNVVIALGLAAGLALAGMPILPTETAPLAVIFLSMLMWANVSLVVFNLIPAFPLDGGRVLRAMLEMGFGKVRATEIAAGVATPIAVGFGLLGLLSGNLILVLIAFVLWTMGQMELMAVRHQARAESWARPEVDLSARPDVANFTGYTWDERNRVWIVWRGGMPVGVAGSNVR